MGKQIVLNYDNAEEVIYQAIAELKNKVASNARREAFDDCSKYWAKQVEEIIKDDCPNSVKVFKIRKLFNIDL